MNYEERLPAPMGSKLLIRVLNEEKKSAGGIVLADEGGAQCRCYGEILAIGPYAGYRRGIPFVEKGCDLGDIVIFYKHTGTLLEYKLNGESYRIIEWLDLEGNYGKEEK